MAALVCVCDGDSITAGASSGTTALPVSWSWRINMPGLWTISNVGVPGQTLVQMIANAPSVVDPLFNGSAAANVLTVWGGTNDFATGATVAATYANLITYCNARKAVGWKIIVIGMLSRTGTNPVGGETLDADKNAYNALIAANYKTFADSYIAMPATLTADGAYANLTYFQADGIHPNQSSNNTIEAPIISPVVYAFAPLQSGFLFTQTASDTFNRANENPLNPSNWTKVGGATTALQIVSNTCESTATGSLSWEAFTGGAPWGNDQYSQAAFTVNGTSSSQQLSPSVRSSTAALTSYESPVLTLGSGSFPTTVRLFIQKIVGGSNANLAQADMLAAQGDIFTVAVIGTTIYGFQNGVLRVQATDAAVASGTPGLLMISATANGNLGTNSWSAGTVQITHNISGSAGVPGALVSYSGTMSGSVAADASGNYVISGLIAGSYTITPSLSGYKFSPKNSAQTISGADITGVNFTASPAGGDRAYGFDFKF